MISSLRPPFFLAYAADQQGCGHHRITIPLASLIAGNMADGRIEMSTLPGAALRATAPDTVIWQRPVEHSMFDAMRMHRQVLPDAFFVYEIDDYVGRLPEKSYHSGFMPPNLEAHVAEGIALCDAVTTTTEPLADWLRELGAADVRVVPNAIPMSKFRAREGQPGPKLRVGWGGGISHTGDLEMLRHAMTEIGSDVTWVFLGMKPKNPPVPVEFERGLGGPMAYLDTLAGLNLDLALAPLEYNRFNECKSNLRLLEAGAIGVPVIAQRILPYLTDTPPVFGYAESPEDWTREIRRFIGTPNNARQRNARALQAWVSRHYTAERRLSARLAGWMPAPAAAPSAAAAVPGWRPRPPNDTVSDVVVVVQGTKLWIDLPPSLQSLQIETTLEDGCRRALDEGAHLLWLRPGTTLSERAWTKLRAAVADTEPVAGASLIASDGINAYPQRNGYTPTEPAAARIIDDALAVRFGDRQLAVNALGGPCILLHRAALSMFGAPDAAGQEGNDEIAIMEWSLRIPQKGWRLIQLAGAYAASHIPPQQCRETAMLRLHGRGLTPWMQAPCEELAAADREALDLLLLRSQWSGVQPGTMGFDGGYATWAALRGALPPVTGDLCEGFRQLGYGAPIPADATWLLFMDSVTKLKDGALDVLSHACAMADDATVAIYGDHELRNGSNLIPFFKTDFDLELLLAQDYLTPVVAIRRDIVPARTLTDAADLYQCLLQATAMASGRGLQALIRHIPEILAARPVDPPEEAAVMTLQRQVAIEKLLGDAVDVRMHDVMPGTLKVIRRWQAMSPAPPLVSIIVLTRGDGWLLQPCINTVLKLTEYQNYEIMVVGSGEREPEIGELAKADPRVRVLDWPHPFNWSAKNNFAVREARGDILCFMNDDARVTAPEWLDAMLGQVLQPDVGAVGARLIHTHGVVQHVGVVVHNGINGHVHKNLPVNKVGAYGWAMLTHEATAVTGACMLVRRQCYDEVGGFLELLAHNYNDTHFCMELRRHGYRNVVEVAAELLHNEGSSRPSVLEPEGGARQREEYAWMRAYDSSPDPYWHPHVSLATTNSGLMVHGLHRDMLDWRSEPPAADAQRVLLINDRPGLEGIALALHHRGEVVFAADLSGFVLQLTTPRPANAAGWDIRRPDVLRTVLDTLGIDRIVLQSLVGCMGAAPPVEALNGLYAIGVPVTCGTAVAPPADGAVPPEFELTDRTAWRRAYARLVPVEHPVMEAAG